MMQVFPDQNLPGVKQGNHHHGDKEVDDSRAKDHVETACDLLIERNAAPGGFLHNLSVIDQVVHLGEEGPGEGRHEADQPDPSYDFLGFSCRGA
jgi:hypothetical protein